MLFSTAMSVSFMATIDTATSIFSLLSIASFAVKSAMLSPNLVERKGCNAEYHLGCFYNNYRPSLFSNGKKVNKDDDDEKEGHYDVMDIAAVVNTPSSSSSAAGGSAMGGGGGGGGGADAEYCGFVNNTDSSKEMIIPPGEMKIYCAQCHSDGSTVVLEKYFDKVDYERSHFTCCRAYVVALHCSRIT